MPSKETEIGAVLIGRIKGSALEDFRAWAQSVPLADAVHSAYAPRRREAWYRRALHLSTSEIERHPEPPERVQALSERLLPGWHSALLCGADTSISAHRDASGFEAHAVLINLGAAQFTYWPQQRITTPAVHVEMIDGGVYRLNVKILHAAKPLSAPRMSYTLRKIKAEVLAQERPTLLEQLQQKRGKQ